jgi:hypothetical protein
MKSNGDHEVESKLPVNEDQITLNIRYGYHQQTQ